MKPSSPATHAAASAAAVPAVRAAAVCRSGAAPVIVTSGEGVVKRAPDRAWVTIGAESHAKTAQRSAARQHRRDDGGDRSSIKAAGIPADAIQTSGYNLQPEFDYVNGKQTLRGYVARNQVQVRVDTLAKTGDIMAAAVVNGATTVSGVRFDLKDRDGAEREALRLAVRDARRRADALASWRGRRRSSACIRHRRTAGDASAPCADGRWPLGDDAGGIRPRPCPIEAGEIEIRAPT